MAIQIKPILCGNIQEVAYLVYDDARTDCVLVDPGDDYGRLKRALAGRELAAILLTHGHFDHMMSAGALHRDTGAPVWASEQDGKMLNDAELNGLKGLMGVDRMDTPEITPEVFGKTLSVAGLDFEILPTPGHTGGSVCLYLRDAGVMFSGDTLFYAGFGRLDLPTGSTRDMYSSLQMLFGLPGDVKVYPGHGPATTLGAEKRRYRL